MTKKSAEEYNQKKDKELFSRVDKEMKAYDKKNYLEKYALYMARVQMYEHSLKQDLKEIFGMPEEDIERMNLAAILRCYEKHDIRAHPILYAHITDIAKQRNIMAHEFLAAAATISEISGIESLDLFRRDLDKWTFELELAFQNYLMLKEDDVLYRDWGVKPTYPYPKHD